MSPLAQFWPAKNVPTLLAAVFTRIALVFLLACFLCACEEKTLPPGTIATVNGEPISLHSVQALLDSRSAALGIPPRPSVAEMQTNYRQALGILIAHTLVRQELASRGIPITPKELDEAINQVREDFGEESLDGFLGEASLREDEWRLLMRDHLALEVFTERILLPSIKISLAEIKAYYREHEKDFVLPESFRVCYAVADERAALEAWCKGIENEAFEPGPLAQCVETTPAEIPDPWQNDLKKIRMRTCGKLVEQNGEWRVIAPLEHNKSVLPQISEVYGMIENILLEQKKEQAFDQWLEQKLAGAKILGAPALFPAAQNEQE